MANVDKEVDNMESETCISSTLTTVGADDTKAKEDKLIPVVERIMNREKENQQDIKTVRQFITSDNKRILELNLTWEAKRRQAESLMRDNQTIDASLKAALNHIKAQIMKIQETTSRPSNDVEQNLETMLKQLQKLLENVNNEIETKQKFIDSRLPSEEQKQPNVVDIDKLHADAKRFLRELKKFVKAFLMKVTYKLRRGGGDSVEKFETFEKCIQKVLEVVDSYSSAKKDKEQVAKRRGELDEQKRNLHNLVAKRLKDRKPLAKAWSKIRREFEEVSKNGKKSDIPQMKINLTTDMKELWAWTKKEAEYKEKLLDQLKKQQHEMQTLGGEAEKQRKEKMEEQLADEKGDDELLAKLEQEKKTLAEEVEKSILQSASPSFPKTAMEQIKEELKEINEEKQQTTELSSQPFREEVEKGVAAKNEKQKQNEEEIEKLAKQKKSGEETLHNVLRETSLLQIHSAKSNENELMKQLLEHRLENVRRDKQRLQIMVQSYENRLSSSKPAATESSKEDVGQIKQRIQSKENELREKTKNIQSIKNEMTNLQRQISETESQGLLCIETIKRTMQTNEILKRKLQREKASLSDVEEELKREQESNELKRGRSSPCHSGQMPQVSFNHNFKFSPSSPNIPKQE